MGQVYSFLGYASTAEDNNLDLDTLISVNFSCKVCVKILHDPVQCQNNEHYFCRKCITEHLGNSETCPLCMDQLTLEMLRPVPRVILDVVSQMKKPRFKENAKVEELLSQQKCGRIFIFGGTSLHNKPVKSVEVFNCSTKTWILIENCLFFNRLNSFSFRYGKKIMVCGGKYTERIEYLNPSENEHYASVSSVCLPSYSAQYNGLLYENRILTFTNDVVEISLESPGKSRILLKDDRYAYSRNNSAGVHCFGNNIYIVGGHQSTMEKYDVTKNELQTLPSLPYTVSNMATVAYKDNIIIVGGYDGNNSLNDVVMFDATSQEYKRLPSMLEKRSNCAAVMLGEVIVVMGGRSKNTESMWKTLKTVECYQINDSAWQELPAMHLPRAFATACVYV